MPQILLKALLLRAWLENSLRKSLTSIPSSLSEAGQVSQKGVLQTPTQWAGRVWGPAAEKAGFSSFVWKISLTYPFSSQCLLGPLTYGRSAHVSQRPQMDFPVGAVDKNPLASAGDMGLIAGLGRCHMLRST